MGKVYNLRVYKLLAKSKDFQKEYIVNASSLQEASKKVYIMFANKFNPEIGDIKISMAHDDLPNHIDEILETLHG